MNRNTANRFYLTPSVPIAEKMEKAAPLHGEVRRKGAEESCSDNRRERARGRQAVGRFYHSAYRGQGEDANADQQVPGGTRQHRHMTSLAGYGLMNASAFRRRCNDHCKPFIAVKDHKRHTGNIENFGTKRDAICPLRVASRRCAFRFLEKGVA